MKIILEAEKNDISTSEIQNLLNIPDLKMDI